MFHGVPLVGGLGGGCGQVRRERARIASRLRLHLSGVVGLNVTVRLGLHKDGIGCQRFTVQFSCPMASKRLTKISTSTICGIRFATTLVQSGNDLYKVQQLLGHKSPIMTQRYAHHYPESLRGGVEILDPLLESSTKIGSRRVCKRR